MVLRSKQRQRLKIHIMKERLLTILTNSEYLKTKKAIFIKVNKVLEIIYRKEIYIWARKFRCNLNKLITEYQRRRSSIKTK